MEYRNQKTENTRHTSLQLGNAVVMTLFVILLILKLTHAVSWSWWLITLPVWIVPVVLLLLTVAAMALALLQHLKRTVFTRKKRTA